ncbi:hypothetical protein EK21DRAFT_61652 [Setomelanomma holmii]|uniref:Transcription factor TFIIIC triple barrel domain-containing protein n=1 Tax=Setomelanomma holmii TaxID=210430 RepID=A0A9P4HDL6_9PLEO|nr:hypothetical protein EK21DRAFT_61652 [Setomelanomma holmii]
MADVADDEWEYEYDETEAEDFYIPIDLSNVPSAQVPTNSERRPGHPTLLKSRLRALNATRGQAPGIANNAGESGAQETSTMGELQITGLHTPNPLIMYNGDLLSCHWTSTIGTDMFFTKPEADNSDLGEPLRTLPSVDLLSLGTAKLDARVGRLRPRDELFDDDNGQQGTNGEAGPSQGADVPALPKPAVAESPTHRASIDSTGFLARLNEAKARRGDSSLLVVAQTPEGTRLVSAPMPVAVRPNESDQQLSQDIIMSGT